MVVVEEDNRSSVKVFKKFCLWITEEPNCLNETLSSMFLR